MRKVNLQTLRQWLQNRRPVCPVNATGDIPISGLAVDSRSVRPGELFVAIKGESVDSHDFISQALARGASAVLAQRKMPHAVPQLIADNTRGLVGPLASYFLGDPSRQLRIVGITGTNGKTTVAYGLWKILSVCDGVTAGMLGTVENILGRGAGQKPVTTTPGPLPMQLAFAEMLSHGSRSCVMEVSSHGIVQQRIAGVDFDAGVLTNIGSDHLDYHGSLQAYQAAKSLFFEELPPSACAVLNGEDPQGGRIADRTSCRTVLYGLAGWPGLRRCVVDLTDRIVLSFEDADGGAVIHTRALGRYNAENLCAMVCCARMLGAPWEAIETALQDFSPPPGRLQEVPAPGFRVFIDYAHTACALGKVLESLRPVARHRGGRLRLVFGCGGDRDRRKRPVMGQTAVNGADHVVLTSDNPRTESPDAIIDEVLTGMKDAGAKLVVARDRKEAIQYAVAQCLPGDILLIAGKGHEDYQIVGTSRHHFDDREVAVSAVEALNPHRQGVTS